jgi:TonB family protein
VANNGTHSTSRRFRGLAGALVLLVACGGRSAAPPPTAQEAPHVVASCPDRSQPKTEPKDVVYSVGGDVRPPVLVLRVEPLLPEGAQCRGLVVLEAVVDAEGRPTAIRDLSRSPDAFTAAYARAVAAWRFRPATRLGQPVAVRYTVTVSVRCA